jgi:hypothetical protein
MKNKELLQRKLFRPWNAVVWTVVLSVFITGYKSMAQVTVADSTALVAFYNSTNGGSWASATNWLSGPVST